MTFGLRRFQKFAHGSGEPYDGEEGVVSWLEWDPVRLTLRDKKNFSPLYGPLVAARVRGMEACCGSVEWREVDVDAHIDADIARVAQETQGVRIRVSSREVSADDEGIGQKVVCV